MSVDSKLIVTCGKDKMFDVMRSVTQHLNKYSRGKLDAYLLEKGLENRLQYRLEDHKSKYTNGCSFDGRTVDVISFNFGSGDDNLRSLMMFCDCSCDYQDTYEGEKIIFSIGAWGSNDEIMKVVAEAVSGFGDVYYDFNDCDDDGFVKIC